MMGHLHWVADLILELVVFVVVLLELDPDSYVVVALEVYPPSIAVLDPDVLVCVDPANAAEVSSSNIINIRGFFILKFRL